MPINSEKKLHLIHKSLGFRGLLEISKYKVKKMIILIILNQRNTCFIQVLK